MNADPRWSSGVLLIECRGFETRRGSFFRNHNGRLFAIKADEQFTRKRDVISGSSTRHDAKPGRQMDCGKTATCRVYAHHLCHNAKEICTRVVGKIRPCHQLVVTKSGEGSKPQLNWTPNGLVVLYGQPFRFPSILRYEMWYVCMDWAVPMRINWLKNFQHKGYFFKERSHLNGLNSSNSRNKVFIDQQVGNSHLYKLKSGRKILDREIYFKIGKLQPIRGFDYSKTYSEFHEVQSWDNLLSCVVYIYTYRRE